MLLLILGVVLFAVAHLGTTAFSGVRASLSDRIGAGPVKGIAALLLVLSVYLIIQGWRAADYAVLWTLPGWAAHVVVLLMLPALILFFGSYPGSKMRALVRHPQLTGFKLWATLHLLVNGDTRSLVLFGGLLAWGVVELILLNRRDGKGALPPVSPSLVKAWGAVPIGILAWVVIIAFHARLFGVSPLG